jgi:hypothetical protein
MGYEDCQKQACSYAEHRRRQHEYEQKQYRGASLEEKKQRWETRKTWLIDRYLEQPSVASQIAACPRCVPETKLKVRSWPTWFVCKCGTLYVLDMGASLCNDDIEKVVLEPLTSLKRTGLSSPVVYTRLNSR